MNRLETSWKIEIVERLSRAIEKLEKRKKGKMRKKGRQANKGKGRFNVLNDRERKRVSRVSLAVEIHSILIASEIRVQFIKKRISLSFSRLRK